jgi:hypothetical protein
LRTLFAKAFASWVVLLVLAVLNGGARDGFLTPRVGAYVGHLISTGILCGMIFPIAWFSVPWLGPRRASEAWLIGAVWTLLTIAFELLGGHYLFRNSWERLLADYNLLPRPRLDSCAVGEPARARVGVLAKDRSLTSRFGKGDARASRETVERNLRILWTRDDEERGDKTRVCLPKTPDDHRQS